MRHRPHHAGATAQFIAVLLITVCALGGCAHPRPPTVSLSPDDTVKAAQRLLTDRCLTAKGLTPPRPDRRPPSAAEGRRIDRALFGTGRTELSLRLPSGHVFSQHTDGCLAGAQRELYGDQKAWFRSSTTVNNLRGKAPTKVRASYDDLRARALTRARALLRTEINTEARKGPTS
ncbi:hypothetical protein P8605_16490 [Streptomyces sp. T-3]|nr:hypothetical protein [Streptomyces sp. T-3]